MLEEKIKVCPELDLQSYHIVFSKDKFVGQALDIPLFSLQAFSCYSFG